MTHELKLEESPDVFKTIYDELRHGDDVVLTKNSEVVVKFVLAQAELNPKRKRVAGFAKNEIIYVADDFDAPLEDFKDYM